MSEQRGKRGRPRTGHRVALSAILPACRFIGCDDIVAGGCHDAAGQVRPGDVYVARCTATGDGHEAIGRAIARGAIGIVAERIVATAGVPLCVVRDGNWAFARLTQALAGDPARRLKVIAVTGTSGKTTTAWLTAAVLAEAGLEVGVLSDLGCLGAGDDRPVAVDLTRPARLAEWLGRLAAGGCTHAVVEVSSRMLAAQALAGVACDTVVVTNLGTAHLDEHGTRRAYHALKGRLVAGLGERGCLVSGVRGGKLARLLARAPRGTNCLTAGLAADCDVQARSLERGLAGRTFLLAGAGESVPVATTTPVVPFVRDAVLAAAVGARYGVPLATAARGLEAAGAVPGRVERVDRGQDAAVFIDQPTSGHALAATLASLRRLTPGRLAVLAEDRVAGQLGGRGFAAGVGRWCDACTIVPATVLDEDAGKEAVAAYARVDRLLSTLGPRDCLLVLGAAPLPPLPPDGGEPSYRPAVATLVDAWLRLAHPPVAAWGRAA